MISRIKDQYERWQSLKAVSRKTDKQQRNENSFTPKLDELFDIAHANALQMITLKEDKEFLKAQHEKGRCGSFGSDDIKLSRLEAQHQEKKVKAERKKSKIV